MTRNAQLAHIITKFTHEECLTVAIHLRAAGEAKAAGIWFEAGDIFERILIQLGL